MTTTPYGTGDVLRHVHPVMAAAKLKSAPVGVTIDGHALVLFRDHRGRVAALDDRCPHRFAPLSKGRVRPDGRLECSYHGWNFDGDGRGQSPSQPSLAKCDLRSYRAIERHGYIWVCHHDTPDSAFPVLAGDGFDHVGTFAMRFAAPLHVALDNFSEDEHVPWVHHRLGWNEAGARAIEFSATTFDDRCEVSYRGQQRPSRLVRLLGLENGDIFYNNWVARFSPVHVVYTIQWTAADGTPRPFINRSAIFMVPETATSTWFHVFTYVKLHEDAKAVHRWLLPVARSAALVLGWFEIRDDALFIPRVARTPFELKGMRLDKYDKPIVHNHKLLRSIYWAERESIGEAASTDEKSVARIPA